MREANVQIITNDLNGFFWTRLDEMIQDIENEGYSVLDANNESLVIGLEDDEDEEMEFILYIGHANTTMWIQSVR